MTDGEVRLEVPASPEFLRVARMMAAGVASRLGFTLEEVDDLSIAIDELCFSLVGTKGRPGMVELEYRLVPGGLEVRGTGRFDEPTAEAGLSELSELILAAVTDEHEVSLSSGVPTFRMVKRRDED